MKTHFLKTWPSYFMPIMDGVKTFELRENDRDFQEGDTLVLMEYDQYNSQYTGRWIKTYPIRHILYGGNFGLPEGYCVISLDMPPREVWNGISQQYAQSISTAMLPHFLISERWPRGFVAPFPEELKRP